MSVSLVWSCRGRRNWGNLEMAEETQYRVSSSRLEPDGVCDIISHVIKSDINITDCCDFI